MRARLVRTSQRRKMEATGMKPKYFITPAHYPSARFTFIDFGGSDNCARCDKFDHVNEYTRDDGLVQAFCKKCEMDLEL
jgi:hypothetical protein